MRGRRIARAVAATGRELLARDLVVGSLGNVSARDGAGMAITPTRLGYEHMRAGDVVVLGLDGTVIAGRRAPSREWRMHAAIYSARAQVGAIVHTHSVHATAWSFAGLGPLPHSEELDYFAIGAVATSAPAPPASEQLARSALAALGDGRAALLGEHGAVAVGADVTEALLVATVVERQARIACLTAQLRATLS